MSAESTEWLNTYTLIGNTDQRGNAWHYRIPENGEKDNHYPGFIPVDDVNERLFNWNAIEKGIYTLSDEGTPEKIVGRKAIVRSDTNETLGIFKEGYQGHSYREWLIDNVSTILGDELGISSAGLLRNGAQAWVEVSIPETITTPVGFEFRPNLLAYTSFDGSLATNYGRKVTATVCDNTLAAARSEKGQSFKLRHTKHSALKIAEAREALAIVYTIADDFAAEVEMLANWEVSEKAFDTLVSTLIPITSETSKSGTTTATKKRDEIFSLYRNDIRASQWNGTALGVLQAFNTYSHHIAQVRKGTPRVLRNYENAIKGKTDESDNLVLTTLAEITKHNSEVVNA